MELKYDSLYEFVLIYGVNMHATTLDPIIIN